MTDIYAHETGSPVPGDYADDFHVKPTSFTVGTTTKPITWINKYVFYMKWDDGNHQLFVYDTGRNLLFQNVNQIQWEAYPKARFSPKPAGLQEYQKEARPLGDYGGNMVYDTFCGMGNASRNIAWVNPLTFYFYHSPGNEQVWTYDFTTKGYIQFGSWAWSVRDAFNRDAKYVHTKLY